MRTSHEQPHTHPMHDPLGLTARAHERSATAKVHSDNREVPSVNPLWMITAGLGAFVVLLVIVW